MLATSYRGLLVARDLTQHLTTRAGDSHAPVTEPSEKLYLWSGGRQDVRPGRFFALLRIKPHAPPLVRVPVNSFEFSLCGRTPQAGACARCSTGWNPSNSTHRLRRGLPGYLICLLPAFEPPSISANKKSRLRHWFLHISAFHRYKTISLSSSLKSPSFQ